MVPEAQLGETYRALEFSQYLYTTQCKVLSSQSDGYVDYYRHLVQKITKRACLLHEEQMVDMPRNL